MRTTVAIDPGLSGGVAVRWFGKTDCWPMPGPLGREIRNPRSEIRKGDL